MLLMRRRADRAELSLKLTSMVDMVFLLIIFFMCAADMSRREAEVLTLPVAESARPESRLREERLVINVCRDGRLRMSGRTYVLAETERLIASRAAMAPAPEGGSSLNVRIRADADASYRHVQAVMGACSRARVSKVSFAAVPGSPEEAAD